MSEITKTLDIHKDYYRIYRTKDYKMFKEMEGNRKVNPIQVERLIFEYKKRGNKFLTPVIVNEEMQILDGQHRFEALQEMQETVEFIVREGGTIHDVRSINLINKNWNMKEHLYSRVKLGDERYINIHNLMLKYNVALQTVLMTLANRESMPHHLREELGNTLEFTFMHNEPYMELSWEATEEILQKMHEYAPYMHHQFKIRSVQRAIWQMMRRPHYEHSRMIDQLEKYHKTIKYEGNTTNRVKWYLNQIYNYRKPAKYNVMLITQKEFNALRNQ